MTNTKNPIAMTTKKIGNATKNINAANAMNNTPAIIFAIRLPPKIPLIRRRSNVTKGFVPKFMKVVP